MSSTTLKPVAFAAKLNDLQLFKEASLKIKKNLVSIEEAGIYGLRFHTQKILNKDIVLATMDISLDAESTMLWSEVQKNFPTCFETINTAVSPHQRCSEDHSGAPWLITETVCKIRPSSAAEASNHSTWHSAVTELKKEKESEYRLLHDNVWPGVIDAIGSSNISRFDLFLIEFGNNQPHLFYLFQHTGDDFEKDMEAQSSSPVNQRWWKFTDACQEPLPGANPGPWLDMVEL